MAKPARVLELRVLNGLSLAEQAPESGHAPVVDDTHLVDQVLVGDSLALETLYRRYAGFAFNLAVRISGNAADVEDIVHDAFLRAHQCLHELSDKRAFRSWLGSIVVRLVRTRLRRRRLLSALGLITSEPVDLDALANAEASAEERVLLAQTYALLQTLAPDDRIAWTLRYVEQHRLEAVAEIVGCSLATAKRRILRVQRFLKEHFVAPYPEKGEE